VLPDCRVCPTQPHRRRFQKTDDRLQRHAVVVGGLWASGLPGRCSTSRERSSASKDIAVPLTIGKRARSPPDRLLRSRPSNDAALLTILRLHMLEIATAAIAEPTRSRHTPWRKAIGGKAARRISQECLELLGPSLWSKTFLPTTGSARRTNLSTSSRDPAKSPPVWRLAPGISAQGTRLNVCREAYHNDSTDSVYCQRLA